MSVTYAQMESPCSNDEGDEFGARGRRRGTNSSFLMRMASSPTPTHLAATAEHERGHEPEEGEAAGNSNSELTRPSQGGIGSNG